MPCATLGLPLRIYQDQQNVKGLDLSGECMCLGQVQSFCGCICAFVGLFGYENQGKCLSGWISKNVISKMTSTKYFFSLFLDGYTMIAKSIPNRAASNKRPLNSQLFVDFDATAFKVCTHQAQLIAKSTPKRGWFWIQIRRPPVCLRKRSFWSRLGRRNFDTHAAFGGMWSTPG